MASGNREVELVIRAKNEASKALDSVTSALDTLTQAQAATAKGADKTGDLLAQLGAQLGKLQQQVAGASTLDRLATSMERAAGSVARLEQSMAGLTGEQAQLAAEVKAAESALGALTAKALNLQQTLNQQSAATAKAKSEFNALSAEVRSGESALNKTVQNSGRYEAQLASLESKLAATGRRHRELTVEILRAESPSKKLIASFEKTDAALQQQVSALAKARAAYAQNGAATREIEQNLARLRTAQATAAQAFDKAKVSQDATSASLREVGIASRETEKQLGGLKGAAAENAAAIERQGAALAKSRTEFLAVQAAAAQANVSLERIGATVRQGLLRSLVDSQAQLQRYRQEWVQATAAIKAAVASGANVSNPTPELTASIAAAQRSKAAYQELQVAIQQMRTSVREAGTDVGRLASAQQVYTAALDRVKAKTAEVSAAQNAMAANANAAGAASVSAANRQAQAYGSVASSVNRMGSAASKAGSDLTDLASKGRQALTWGERMRSEMIALATTFVGVYAAIEQLGNVTQTFQDMEAVTSRLNVAFSGNAAVVQREFRFIQGEADRLGVDIRVLAGEYSKLAIATKGSALEGEQTRTIFIRLAEAFRVNKLSADQMQGAFNAITQMVSKGNVSMEELRQQLGERLYGAFTLAGKAMNLTGEELSKLIAEGKLATDEFLPKFAEEINKTFGPELPKSLQSLSADIGRFGNEVTKVQMLVANGGFVEGLRAGLQSLTEFFQSKEGQNFFKNLGAAAGGLIKVLAVIPKYIDEISIVLAVLIGRKATGWITGLATGFNNFRQTLTPLAASVKATTVSVDSMGIAVQRYSATATSAAPLTTRLAASVTALGASARAMVSGMTAASVASTALTASVGVLRTALAALGGPVGLIVTGLSVAFTYWLTSTNDVVNATEEHQRQMTALLDTYSQAKDKAGDWAKEVKGVSLAGAEQNLNNLKDQLATQAAAVVNSIGGAIKTAQGYQGTSLFGETGKQVAELSDKLTKGEITVKEFQAALDALLKSGQANDALRGLIQRTSDLVAEAVKGEQALSEQAKVVDALGGTVSGVSPKVLELAKSFEELATEAGLAGESTTKTADPLKKLQSQFDKLKASIPKLGTELKHLETLKSLDQILQTAETVQGIDRTTQAYKDFVDTVKRGRQELNNALAKEQFKDVTDLLTDTGSGKDLSAKLLRNFEGFRSSAYYDVNAFRAGYGSDTVTLSDGTIQKVTKGMQVSVEDANRDLLRRIDEFQNTIRGQIGSERFSSFNPQQQAALTSVAYNYGSLPDRILEAVRKGTNEEIATAIRGLAGDNKGVNAERRNKEAFVFTQGDVFNAEGMAKLQDKALEKAQKFHEELQGQLELTKEKAEADKRITLEQAQQIALTKEENRARAAGTTLTASERDQIMASAAAEWQKKDAIAQAAEERRKEAEFNKQAAAGEREVNTLLQQRRDLLELMKFASARGDVQGYEQLKQQYTQVTENAQKAIEAMIKFWDAAGNQPKADAARVQLETLNKDLESLNNKAIVTGFTIGRTLGDNLSAFGNNFLAKIRETGDVLGSLRESFLQFASDFLLQIAQMILKQAILNALMAASGGGGGFVGGIISAFGGTAAGVQHTGGIAGDAGNVSRTVSPAWFLNAVRYHSGGVAGLKPDEVPTILQKGEEVLTESDPRHRNNGGAAAQSSVKIVNAIDAGSFVSAGVEDKQGQKAILNFIRANRGAVKSALNM